MKSPFAIFRKHQKMAMAILTGLSMFAFVVMEQVRADSQLGLPILAAAIGMLLFGIFGYRRGETVTWAVAGTAIGVAVAVIAMRLAPGGPKAPVQTTAGDISHEELNNLITRRNNANNFLRLAFEKAVPPRSTNQMFLNYYEQQLRSIMFGFGSEDTSNDVILGYLLDKEADEMGLSVSDGTISDYINKVTSDKLTPSDYREILKSLRLTDSQVYDAMRGELRARLAMEILLPRSTPTPEQYWDDYRKLQTTQTLDVAAVPVADFLAEAPQPTEEDVTKYYTTWKGIPSQAPGAPGLFQPRRARIEFVEADFAEVEKQVAAKPVSDAEVKKYYEDHKQEYRNRPPAGSTLSPLMQTPNALTDPNLTAPSAPILPPPGPQLPPAKQPTAPNLPAPSAPAAPPTKQTAPPGTSGPKSTLAPKSNGGTSKSGASLDRHMHTPGHDGEMLALADGPFDQSLQLADQSAPVTKPAAPPAETKPATKNQPASAKSHDKPASTQEPREPKPPAMPRPAGSSKPESEPEFRPLDDLLQREIRDQILRNRTIDEMKLRTQAAADFMKKLRDKLIPEAIGGEPAMNAEQRAQALTEYAAKHALKYGITPLMSPYELHEAVDRFPIAAATKPVENPFENKQPIDVIREVFGMRAESLFQPAEADDRDTHWFAFWKVEDVAEHTPTLDEPGVREQVIRGWQIETFAQKAAETRAKELADLARKSTKPMTEALAGQTVTNKPKGPAVVVIPTTPFSWYSTSSTAPQGLMPETAPRISDIVGVKEVDDTFMKTIFEELKVGDVKAVPNFGPSVYYVVRVKSRHPDNAEQLAVFRTQFMKENFFGSFLGASTYDYMNGPAEQRLRYEWAQRLEAKYGVKRNAEEEPVRQTRSRGRTG